jgi:hypothetical protein
VLGFTCNAHILFEVAKSLFKMAQGKNTFVCDFVTLIIL